jgi:urease accessory protein
MKKTSMHAAFAVLAAGSLLPVSVLAHPGVGATSGFAAGFGHPLSGIDHLLAMVAVGLWAAQLGGRALWAVPATFVTLMLAGAGLGMYGVPVPFVEAGILFSVLVLGVLVAGAYRLPVVAGAMLVGAFALFHGHAHGSEMPLSVAGVAYCTGFAVATAMLHATGMAAGLAVRRLDLPKLARLAGGAIAVSGLYLAVA